MCWKPCLSSWSLHLLREEFLSAPIHFPPLWFAVSVLHPVACLLRVALVPESSRSLPLLHVGPCRQFLSELDVAPCPARFGTFLDRSSEFVIFSGLVPGLLGVKFASLHDLYGALRSCHKVLDELIPEVSLSTSKPCINTKLQN
jgi:hypothetical protein